MRRCIKIIICGWLAVAASGAKGQEVEFLSPIVEQGIRLHLNLGDEEQITLAQLDTITTLDLSRRGITDIRDLTLMPDLHSIDLSDNQVENLRPLTMLDKLEWVDLSFNSLTEINDLFYSSAKNLTINVAFNYITDFSLFGCISSCDFTLQGAGLQLVENAPYVDIYPFYADIDSNDKPSVSYRCSTNLETAFNIEYGTVKVSALTDGSTNTVFLPEYKETTKVVLTNGEIGETTYVVPSAEYTVGAGKTVTLETGLPEDYSLYFAYASNGTVEIDGTKMNYTSPETTMADFIFFCYYQGATLKGFSRCYVNKVVGDLTGDAKVDDEDFTFVANCIMGKLTSETDKKKADINGDGEVNAADLVALANLKKYGKITPPNGTRKAEADIIGK